MRRLVVTLGVLVMCLGLFPARADAFWWNWIDDLSGPSFGGTTFNWRVWCQTDHDAPTSSETRIRALRAFRAQLNSQIEAVGKRRVALENGNSSAAQKALAGALLEGAQQALRLALTAVNGAIVDVGSDLEQSNAQYLAAQYLRGRAEAAVDIASRVQALNALALSGAESLVKDFANLPELDSLVDRFKQAEFLMAGGGPSGIGLSLCSLDPATKTRSFLSANVGIAHNTTGFGNNKGADYLVDKLRMVTLGFSYHANVTRYLAIGSGAGLAIFSSDNQNHPTFQKLYVEPYIIDFKPARTMSDAWWADIFAFRVNSMIFPTGFAPGSFRRSGANAPIDSDRIPAELVRSVGLFIDLEPLLKRAHGNGSNNEQ